MFIAEYGPYKIKAVSEAARAKKKTRYEKLFLKISFTPNKSFPRAPNISFRVEVVFVIFSFSLFITFIRINLQVSYIIFCDPAVAGQALNYCATLSLVQ